MYNGTRTILELFMIYGLTSRNAWNRYFFNEERYYGIQKFSEDVKEHNSNKQNLDLSNPDDLKQFEQRANELNKLFPGFFAPEGQEVNMTKVVNTLSDIKREFRFEKLTSDDLNIINIQAHAEKIPFVAPSYENEGHKGSNNIGTKYPEFLEKPATGSILSAK